MVTADLNGDRIPDVATSDPDGTMVHVLLGNGDGSFQTARSFAAGNGPSAIAVGDLNGDGKADLVLPDSNTKTRAVAILLGNGDGTFQPRKQYDGGAFPIPLSAISIPMAGWTYRHQCFDQRRDNQRHAGQRRRHVADAGAFYDG